MDDPVTPPPFPPDRPGAFLPRMCSVHQKFAADRGVLVRINLALFQQAAGNEAIMRRCGWDPATGAMADVMKLGPIVAELGPLCCWIGDARFTALCWTVAQYPDGM